MALIIRNGKAGCVRVLTVALFFFILAFGLEAQTCSAGGGTPTVHAEGLAEQIGTVSLTCNGGTPGTQVSSLVFLGVDAAITNRLDANNHPTNITVTINGAPYAITPTFNAPNTLLFNPIQYTIPNPSTQNVNIVISGIRVAVPTTSQNLGGNPIVTGTIQGTTLNISNSLPFLALTSPTLLSSVLNYGVPCAGSPLPATLDFPTFISAGTSSSTIRLTEGYNSAFLPKDATGDTGVRLLVNISGYPTGARVFVPDAIVGNRGTTPTTGGAFNSTPNGGTYTPNSNQLLLARVAGADATGNGGKLTFTAPAGQTSFTSVSELTLSGGAAYVTYEVLDSSPGQLDSAQVPVFVVAPATTCQTIAVTSLGATVAPTSTVAVPTAADPIPRFIQTTPASDCTAIGDCSAAYFPQLQVTPTTITLNGSSLGAIQNGFLQVGNGGTSQLTFNVTTTYKTDSSLSTGNWLTVSPTVGIVNQTAGISNVTLTLQANPGALSIAGAYQATVTINAGSAGTVAVPVTFNVGAAGPVVQGVVNSANFVPGPVTANSYVSIFGQNLVKKNTLSVTFDGFPATVLYDGQPAGGTQSQINALIPTQLASIANVGLIVTVDGVASNTFAVTLATNAPAVFNPGIENQDYSVNSASIPAALNDIVQIFLTGLAVPTTGPVTVTIGGLANLTPTYAGVSTISGLEQVNVRVPANLQFANNSAPLSVCVPGSLGQPVCSAPVNLYLH